MKVLLGSPFYNEQRGNSVTVNRISEGLQSKGIETEIINTTAFCNHHDTLPKADIYHGLHAYHFYVFMKNASIILEPYIITMTGTDLNTDLFDDERRKHVIEVLKKAEVIHVFEERARQMVANEIPAVDEKLYVIPQAVSVFPQTAAPYTKEKDTFLFVLPAGIRKIKKVTRGITMLAALKEKFPNIRLWIIGPIIEKDEGELVKRLVNEHKDWVKYLGQLPHSKMGAIYKQADVVLNTSLNEGQPSAILEAMSFGIPPLVSSNNGNRSIVTHGQTGFVYESDQEFLRYAQLLIENSVLRDELGKNGSSYVRENHSLANEISTLMSIYNRIIMKGR